MLRNISKEELKFIIDKHNKWLNDEKGGERANLGGADLSGADLSSADLSSANLRGANLRSADLSSADLSGADLSGANLGGADLRGANLRGANLRSADLSGADLSGAKNMFCPICCPDSGDFIGWKKALKRDGGYCIVKLLVTGDRSSATGRKCRCSEADVLEIQELDGETATFDAVSKHDRSFFYKVGETVSVRDFCLNRWEECATGIHFFITREEAVRYRL